MPDSSLLFYRQWLTTSQTHHLPDELSAAAALAGEYARAGLSDQAIWLGWGYRNQILGSGNPSLQIENELALGGAYAACGLTDSSRYWVDRAVQTSHAHGNLLMPRVLRNKASLLATEGDYQAAVRALHESCDLAAGNEALAAADACLDLGKIMSENLVNHDSARYYFRLGLVRSRQAGYLTGEALINKYMGLSWYRQGNPDSAMVYFDLALQQLQRVPQILELLPMLKIMETLAREKQLTDQACYYLRLYYAINAFYSPQRMAEGLRGSRLANEVREMEHDQETLSGSIHHLHTGSVVQIIILALLWLSLMGLGLLQTRMVWRKQQLSLKLDELSGPEVLTNLSSVPPGDEYNPAETGIGDYQEISPVPIREDTRHKIREALEQWISEKGFLEPSTLAEMAIRLHTNPKYLSAVIAEDYRYLNFNEFLNKLRIDHLISLLIEDPGYIGQTVDFLAAYLGYGSRTTFNNAFRKQTGYTPGDYLKQMRQERKGNP